MSLCLRDNNKGTSLVEMIVAIAIASIVIYMIMFFIKVASNSFRRTSDEVNLQMEAQTSVNQLANLAMEAALAPECRVTASEIRYIFKYSDDEYYAVVHNSTDNNLYLLEAADIESASTQVTSINEHLMAEYVKELNIVASSNGKKVTINLTFALGDDTFSVKKNVRLRNVNR